MSQNDQLIQYFMRYLNPTVFLEFLVSLQDQQYQTLKVQALIQTKNIELIESELKNYENNPQVNQFLQTIKDSIVQVQNSILTPEVNQFIGQVSDLGNVEQLSLEDVRLRFPNFGEKNQKISKQTVMKYINEKIVNQNYSLIEQSYKASQLFYEMGQYEKSFHLFESLKWFFETTDRFDHLKQNIIWGRINLRLVTQIFDVKTTKEDQVKKIQFALQDIKTLSQQLENGSSQYMIKQRADLISLTLLLSFKSQESDFSYFIEIMNQDEFQRVVFSICPFVLNYYAVSLILTKTFDHQVQLNLEQLANLANQTNNLKSYCIIEILNELLSNFNFETANQLVNKLEDNFKNDILIGNKLPLLIENLRNLFFQVYVKIFNQIDIGVYSSYLNCSQDDTEIWLVNAIRAYNLQSKINGNIIEIQEQQNAGQQDNVMKIIKDIYPKTTMLVQNIERFIVTKI